MSRGDQQGSTMMMLPYQVDYHNEASGKRLAATKRRIVWRFGFANASAIANHQTGNNCRGEEHDVSVIWSLTSGKRQVAFDGREISFGKSTEAKLEMSWTMQGGHVVKILAHAAPPLRATPAGFRQFDFLLDGLSFFDMPKIYELGTPSASNSSSSSRGRGGGAARSAGRDSGNGGSNHYSSPPRQGSSYARRHEEEDYDYDQRSFASAPLPSVTPEKSTAAGSPPAASLPTRSASMPAVVVAAVETVDLLGGLNDSSPAVQQQHQPQQRATYQTTAAPVAELTQHHQGGAPHPQYNGYHHPQIQHQHHQQSNPAYYNQQQQQQQQFQSQYAAHQSRGVDEFAPVPPPPRTFQDVSKQILSNYGPDPNAPLALANAPHYDDHAYENSTSSALIADAPHHVTPEKQGAGPLTLRPTMEPVSIAELEAREHAEQYSMSDLERAMKAIVNLDDITETVETPEHAKQQRLKEANKPAGRSKPKPAAQPAWNLGLSPALKDIKDHAAATTPKSSEPTREIMRTSYVHAIDPAAAQAGMMVIYGASSAAAVATPQFPPLQNGIPSVQGFGAGVHASHNNTYAYQRPHQHQQRQPQPQHVMYAAH